MSGAERSPAMAMAMTPRSVKDWHREATNVIQSAQTTHRDASRQFEKSSRAHGNIVIENLNQYGELHAILDQKVKSTNRLIGKLSSRAESLEGSIRLTRQTLTQLEAALKAKEMPLQLCVWREEQREGRPPRERIRDIVTPRLEAQKSDLLSSQKKLGNAVREVSAALLQLEQRLESVQRDQAQKIQALSLDEACFKSTSKSWRKAVGCTPEEHRTATQRLPAAAVTKTPAGFDELSATYKNEVNRLRETERLDRASSDKEQAAKTLREESAKLILHTTKATQEHKARVDQALQEGVRQNQQVRKRLDFEIKETQAKVQHTKATIAQTKERMDSLREPMNNATSCSGWRSRRQQGDIQDPVSTKLAEHQSSVQRSLDALSRNAAEEQRVLKELEDRETQLGEDLRDKTAALQIAMLCLAASAKPSGKAAAGTTASSRSARRGPGDADQGRRLSSAGVTTVMSARS